MKLLFCSPNPLSRELGAPKVLIELADAMKPIGARCELLGPRELGFDRGLAIDERPAFMERLRERLRKLTTSDAFDVVDYDHQYLPFPRREFGGDVLMVARSVLLVHYLRDLPPPPSPRNVRAIVGRFMHGKKREEDVRRCIEWADRTIAAADVVNVSNTHDVEHLVKRGVAREKIVLQPFGLSAGRFATLGRVAPAVDNSPPTVAFVGTFDYRKGAMDFPRLVKQTIQRVPAVRFKLLGTAAMFPTAESVLNTFSPQLRSRVQVIARYDADELPALLAGCSAGVFPSYFEGFGFGVLEMLAAGLPTIAYDAPGPPMMLPPEWLVKPGDTSAMASRVAEFLTVDSAARQTNAIRARALAEKFNWNLIARDTLAAYETALRNQRNKRAQPAENLT